ncbi:tyrosine-protein phosphatase non-receptor type 13-like isoform X2 [Mytilus californianus]|uniref:tyrosine-protein phosphatase non-receptor type 13-like isoform X2 n=2 Tax=Mytilus californianus TaxID=6549 RepID=UPI0022467DE3|nr:tyrosine-protein phosphatase non-receptor type 13-like isoform X2 [Mytilus californianus]
MFHGLLSIRRKPHVRRHLTWKPLVKVRRRKMSQTDLQDSRKGDVILRNLIRQLLTEDESIRFKIALHNFKISKSVTTLCHQLKPIINSTEKIMLLLELSTRLPLSLQEDFHRLCSLQYPHYDAYYHIYHSGNAMPESSKVIAKDSSGQFKIVSSSSDTKLYMANNNLKNSSDQSSLQGTSVTSGIYSEHDDTVSYKMDVKDNDSDVFVWTPQYGQINPNSSAFVSKGAKNVENKRVFLERLNGSLGIGIRGGKEYGSEIFVNHVEEGGAADKQGIKVGDRILEVNGTSFNQMTHAEAVTLMRNAWNVIMMVQAIPQNGEMQEALHIKELEMVLFPSSNDFKLGCATNRKQKSKFLKVKAVDRHSPSEQAGLCVGDFIVKIDGIDVRTLSDKQIMSLTKTKRLTMLIKRLVTDDDATPHLSVTSMENNENRMRNEPHMSSQNHLSTNSQEDYDDEDSTNQFGIEDQHLAHERVKAIYSSPFSPHTPFSSEKSWTSQRLVFKSDCITPPARGRPDLRSPYQYEMRSHSAGRDSQPILVSRPGPGIRYIRSRSQSPHILRQRMPRPRYSKQDLEMIRGIQRGMEKRQRAIRLSYYNAASVDNLDWEI